MDQNCTSGGVCRGPICEDGAVAKEKKRQPTPGDMVRSLAVILIPLLVIIFLFTRGPEEHPVEVVDWEPVHAAAVEESPYPVLAPVNLPEEWRATRVSWTRQGEPGLNGDPEPGNTWQLGFLNPADIYIAIEQSDAPGKDFTADHTRNGVHDGTSTVGDREWQRLVTEDDRTRALVHTDDEVTSIVVGDTSYEDLEGFAATLES